MIHYVSGVVKLYRLGVFCELLVSNEEIGVDLVMRLAM